MQPSLRAGPCRKPSRRLRLRPPLARNPVLTRITRITVEHARVVSDAQQALPDVRRSHRTSAADSMGGANRRRRRARR